MEAARDAMVTYRYVRVGLVALVVFLLVSVGLTWQDTCLQSSISAFFYTRTHAVFVAALCAAGICLIAYQGSRLGEDALLNFSGFLAFVVALIPTDAEGLCQPWLPTETDPFGAVANNVAALFAAAGAGCALYLALQRWRAPQPVPTAEPVDCAAAASVWKRIAAVLLRIEPWLPKALFVLVVAGALLSFWDWFLDHAHIIAAVAFFLGIVLVAVYHACYARAADRHRRARFYAALATVMLATVALAVAFLLADVRFGVFVVELALIVEFAVFWGVQTWDVWDAGDRYPEAAVPSLADAR
ncbi:MULTISPECIES: hypothetical protein [Mycolicibacterium]|uniref:hypothetical protein n=1 Tax=Mycolicibacterium monacense TaxID=85693 RepID=UPI0007E94873|nr:hypothetical protein [Mycolicibacterium monacense]OBB73509.1 diphosphate--fructose-6-phosphate 1-phosphotransferase [Mycolicibacterium monacense]